MLKRQWTDGSKPSRSHRDQKPIAESPSNTRSSHIQGDRFPENNPYHQHTSSMSAPSSLASTSPTPSFSSLHDKSSNIGTRYDNTKSREEMCMMMAKRDTIVQSGQNPFFADNAYMTSMMDYFPGQNNGNTHTSS